MDVIMSNGQIANKRVVVHPWQSQKARQQIKMYYGDVEIQAIQVADQVGLYFYWQPR